MDTECTKDVSVYGSDKPFSPVRNSKELTVALDGALTTEDDVETGRVSPYATNIAYNELSGRFVIPNEDQNFPNVVPRSWLNGQATLQETGRCIGAELEVALLCMQKRLGKVQYIRVIALQKIFWLVHNFHYGCRARLSACEGKEVRYTLYHCFRQSAADLYSSGYATHHLFFWGQIR